MAVRLLLCICESHVAFARFGHQATFAVAVVGLALGLVEPVQGLPVKSKIKLKTSVAMVARSKPKILLIALLLLCVCCCVIFKLLLIVAFVSVSGAVTIAVGVVFVGGSLMWALVGWR